MSELTTQELITGAVLLFCALWAWAVVGMWILAWLKRKANEGQRAGRDAILRGDYVEAAGRAMAGGDHD